MQVWEHETMLKLLRGSSHFSDRTIPIHLFQVFNDHLFLSCCDVFCLSSISRWFWARHSTSSSHAKNSHQQKLQPFFAGLQYNFLRNFPTIAETQNQIGRSMFCDLCCRSPEFTRSAAFGLNSFSIV